MSQDAVLDPDEFLSPIAPDAPVGPYLRWEDDYAVLEEARRADDNAQEGEWKKRERKDSDWSAIVAKGTELLRAKSKDLQIAAWVAEALAHEHGLVGLRDGLRLLAALQEAFWDTIHPENGDLELREGVYEFLNHEQLIPLMVRRELLTNVPGSIELGFSFLEYEAIRKGDSSGKNTSDGEEEDEGGASSGQNEKQLTSEAFEKGLSATGRQYYVDLVEICTECQAVVDQINDFIRERWTTKHPPQLGRIWTALGDVKKVGGQLLAKKPASKQQTSSVDESDETATAEADEYAYESQSDSESESDSDVDSDQYESDEPVARKPARRRRRPGAALESAEDAREQIAEAAHFLREADRSDPTSYLVLRSLAIGGAFGDSGELDPDRLVSPPSSVRETLRESARADDEENWTTCLDEAERAMGRADGRGWLDLHWYSCRALVALGLELPARDCKALLKAFLQAYPTWPEAELRDGTPSASSAARAWLNEEELIEGPKNARAAGLAWLQRSAEPEPDSTSSDEESPPESKAPASRDPWDEAQALVLSGNLSEALAIMAKAARQAASGRERFIRALQQAELCIALDRNALALPILERLAQRIDELHLDQWEETSLCARVFSNLYKCLRGRDEARAGSVYDRLCQLDIGLALQMEGG